MLFSASNGDSRKLMKIGMTAIGIGKAARPNTIRTVVENAERLGFATLWAPEHVVLFDSHNSKYPYRDDGSFMARSNIDLLDPFIGLTYAAAFSQRIRLATGICLVAEHNPLVLAKVIASLDSLSAGRAALGVGIGWSSEEFAALGIPFERRAQRTCEYIEVMRKLWGEKKIQLLRRVRPLRWRPQFPQACTGRQASGYFRRREYARAAASRAVRQRMVRRQTQSGPGGSQNRDAAQVDDRSRARHLGNRNHHLAV